MDSIDESIINLVDSCTIKYSTIAKKLGMPLSTSTFTKIKANTGIPAFAQSILPLYPFIIFFGFLDLEYAFGYNQNQLQLDLCLLQV